VLPIDAANTRDLIEAAVAAVSVLGGAMAYSSGYAATQAVAERQSSDVLGQRVNEGLAEGFLWGWPLSILALIIEMWA
jgi:hypothetical protein